MGVQGGSRINFTWAATLVSNCVVPGPPKPGLRFCFGATVVSHYSRNFPLCLDLLRTNMIMKSVAEVFLFLPQTLSEIPGYICVQVSRLKNVGRDYWLARAFTW